MENLLLCFSSFHVDSDPSNMREEEYAICYEQLLRVLPSNFDVVFIDNTTNESVVSKRLYDIVDSHSHLFYDNNIGVDNKGLGELEMLNKARGVFDFSKYRKISYFTGRRIVTCPYVFERTSNMNKNALISNPPIIRINDGYIYPTNLSLYNDMFFSMKSNVMDEYCTYANEVIESPDGRGSEQILYDFINSHNIEYEWLDWLGFIRNDWEQSEKGYSRSEMNMQFC